MVAQKQDWDGILAELRQATRIMSNFTPAHRNLGWVLEHMHDWDGAIAEYRKAEAGKSDDPAAHEGLEERLLGESPEQC
jgi:hypothetical protein